MVGQDIGFQITGRTAFIASTITAGAGIDNSEQNGNIIDRRALPHHYESAKLIIFGVATLNTSETLSIMANMQDGDDSGLSDAADYVYDSGGGSGLLANAVVLTGLVTAAPFRAELSVNLAVAKRYVRCQLTANLSRAGTDTALVAAVLVFGGADELP